MVIDVAKVVCPECASDGVLVDVSGKLARQDGKVRTFEMDTIKTANKMRCEQCGFEGVAGEFEPEFRWSLDGVIPLEVYAFGPNDSGMDNAMVEISPALARRLVALAAIARAHEIPEISISDKSPRWFSGDEAFDTFDVPRHVVLHVNEATFFWQCETRDGSEFQTQPIAIESLYVTPVASAS